LEKAIVGVDIGGTNTVIGVFDGSMSLVKKHTFPTLKPDFPKKTNNPSLFLDALAWEITRLVNESGYTGRLESVGMGVPGQVDPVGGMVLGAANLAWYNVPVAEEMSRRLGVPVRIDNDVRIYILGETLAGAGKGYTNIIGLTLGTGLAACTIVEGRILRGSNLFAGEIGHDTVKGVTFQCNCGKIGCLETVASASGIARLAAEAVRAGRETSLSALGSSITSYDVYQACVNGDAVAKEVFDFVGTVLGEKLLTAVFLINPEMIIIGGGAAAGEYLLRPIRAVLEQQYTQKSPLLSIGQLGDSAGLIGAAHFAKKGDLR
jgi:glucokinase